jgi:hypothetical protein
MADAVRRRLHWPDWLRLHTSLGAVAPDAYRLISGLGYRPLHFRSQSRAGQRLEDFLALYLRPVLRGGGNDERAFWTGWLCHIMADTVWQRAIQAELPNLWQGALSSDGELSKALRQEYQNACDRVDREITNVQAEHVSELRWALRSAEPGYNVHPLNSAVLSQWVGDLCANALPPPEPATPGTDLISYTFVRRVVEAATEEAITLFSRESEMAQGELEGDKPLDEW